MKNIFLKQIMAIFLYFSSVCLLQSWGMDKPDVPPSPFQALTSEARAELIGKAQQGNEEVLLKIANRWAFDRLEISYDPTECKEIALKILNSPLFAQKQPFTDKWQNLYLWLCSNLDVSKEEIKARLPWPVEEFVVCLTNKASQNDPHAQVALGHLYDIGSGVPKNEPKAFSLYSSAAQNNSGLAQTLLGNCYQYGLSCDKNPEQASYWLTCAANKGVSHAQIILGSICLQHENPSPENLQQANEWFKLAAIQGHGPARNNYGMLHHCAGNTEEGTMWVMLAAIQKVSAAQYVLAQQYQNGTGVPQNFKKALELYKLSAIQGIEPAQRFLLGLFKLINMTDQEREEISKRFFIRHESNEEDGEECTLEIKITSSNH